MGKTVAKVIGVVAFVASFFIPGGVFISGGLLGSSYFAVSFATILQGVAAISASIGFAPEFDAGDAGRQLAENLHITSSPVAVRSVAFGRVGNAGQVLFRKNIENSGETPDELLLILGLAGYPAASLEKFWFNGEKVFDGDSTIGPGAITTGKFADELWVWFRTGDELTDAFPQIAALSTEWDAKQRKLRGIPAIAMRLKVTEKVEGRLEPLAQIKGAKLYDPRLDSSVPGGSGTHDFDDPSTWEWSENPKLAELLYVRGGFVNGVRIFGMGKPKAAIDLENFASEANICEEQIGVVGGGTISRYTCNGLLIPNREHRQNLRLLLSASAGTMDASGGIYRTFAGAWRAPSMTLTESDIDGAPTEIRLQQSPDEEINVINGTFADPVDRWQVKSYPERRDQASIDQVGENAITLDLPFTVDHRTAQRIAKIEMLRVNAARAFGANYWLRTLPLQPGDNVTQTYSRYGIASQTFRVNVWGLEAADDAEGNRRLIVPMQLTEEQQSWFDWDEVTEEKQTTSIVSLPTMDNRPKMSTLGGLIIFEGPFPPANPQVGWLWLDTDVDIVFRWDGSQWTPFSAIPQSFVIDNFIKRGESFWDLSDQQVSYVSGIGVNGTDVIRMLPSSSSAFFWTAARRSPGDFDPQSFNGMVIEVRWRARLTASAGTWQQSIRARVRVTDEDETNQTIFFGAGGRNYSNNDTLNVWHEETAAVEITDTGTPPRYLQVGLFLGDNLTGPDFEIDHLDASIAARSFGGQEKIGFVPDPVTETGKILDDSGAWVDRYPAGDIRLHGAALDEVSDSRAAFAAADALGPVIVDGGIDYVIATSLTLANALTVKAGARVSISSGATLTLNGDLIVDHQQQVFTGDGDMVFG